MPQSTLAFSARHCRAPGKGGRKQTAAGSMDRKEPVIHNEKSLPKYIIADCCHPIPGDDMPGYPDSDGHAYIHKLSAIN